MIFRDLQWIVSGCRKNKLEDISTAGKWVIYGTVPRIKKVFPKIDALVEQGKIAQAKYTDKTQLWADLLPYDPPTLIVYCDSSKKMETLEYLLKLKLFPCEYKLESETSADWKPDGRLRKRSNRQRLRYLFEYMSQFDKKSKIK